MDILAVLFDIDGTLVDSNEQHVNAWAFAFREEGHPQEVDDIRAQIGKGGDLLVPTLLPEAGEGLRKRIADRHGRHFKDMYLDHIRAFEGASDLVARVYKAGRKVVLASSAKREELEHYVELLDVANYLAATTSIDDVETSKPEPDLFRAALEKIGIEPSHAIVVGDTIYDVEAALRCGMVAVGLISGPFDDAQMKDAGAIAVFRNAADLLTNFERSPLSQ